MYNRARRLHSAYKQDCVVAGWPVAKMQKWKILLVFRYQVGERVSKLSLNVLPV